MKRIVTYDVKQGHEYEAFYEYVKQVGAEQITESTYLFDTNLEQQDFANKIRSLFRKGGHGCVYQLQSECKNSFLCAPLIHYL